jgi:nucleotide-binding universal stress UspA family protein
MKILIPIDGSGYSVRAIETGKKYATALGADIVLMHVMDGAIPEGSQDDPSSLDYQEFTNQIKEKHAEIVEDAKKLVGDSISVEIATGIGNPAKRIIEYANENNVDLIVMGSHGQSSTLQRLFVGSVTAKVLSHTKSPVLVVK